MKFCYAAVFVLISMSTSMSASTSVMAASSIAGYEYGGPAARFDAVVNQYNGSGALFRIDGHCQSSCTLFLGIHNVCITPGASLLFHAGHDDRRVKSAFWTQHFLDAYNDKLRSYLLAHHALDEVEKFYTISGRDMIRMFGYRQCPNE